MILDHYLTIKRWTPNFETSYAAISSTGLKELGGPGLPIENYDESTLMR